MSQRRASALLVLLVCLYASAPSPAGPPPAPLPIVEGDSWAYLRGTAEPPPDWAGPAFDDSAWSIGPSGFGYGDGDDATVLADMQNGYLSVYTRKAFQVPDASAVSGLELRVDWDDGFVAFVNGQEVARRSLAGAPGTPVAHDIPATSHEAGAPETIDVPASVLVSGVNVIAVQGHNARLDSSDLSLVVELRAVDAPPQAPANPTPPDGATGVSLAPDLCVTVSDPDDPSLTAAFHGREVTGAAAPEFTIVALPDTQYYSESYPATYTAQTQWIVDNLSARNIAFVTELGDCVNLGATEQQWVNADAAWDLVENPATTGLPFGVPYGIAVGNHDQSPIGDPGTLADPAATTPLYNQYFGVPRFTGRAYYGGHHGAVNDNHYELFEAGGMSFLALHLEYMPADTPLRQDVLAWADGVLKAHPQRRAMLTAHYLINPGDASWSNQGQATWEALKDNHNLFLMLCGHLDQANRRYDEFTDATGTTRVHTLVSDYQSRPNGGNGWLRILTFSPESDTIEVETYSPTLGVFIDGHADNTAGTARNRFTLAYDMEGGLPFDTVGSAAGTSGTQVCVPWPGRAIGTTYEWYAVASDGTSSTTGARSRFTTLTTCGLPEECDDANACTTDTCDAGVCANAPIPGCCASAEDCADGNPCTDDVCAAGACSNPDNTLPCDDGDGCTVGDVCAGGVCAGLPDPCDDANACTLDACTGGACLHTYAPFAGCCAASDDCDDADPCSADSCAGGTCVNTPDANCCDTAAQCDDGEVCTTDLCVPMNGATLVLDGTGDWVTMGSAPGLNASPAFTVEAWIDGTAGQPLDTTGTNGISGAVPLVTKGGPQAETPLDVNMNYFMGLKAGKLVADFEDGIDGGNHPVCGATAIGSGWHHVAATYDGTAWALYVDGVAEALDTACTACTTNCTTTPGVAPVVGSVQHFAIGTSLKSDGTAAGGTAGYYAGRIDEVRVWDLARTPAEIAADRNREIPSAPGLLGRWGCNEGSGPIAADSTTPPEDGTLSGNAGWQSSDLPPLGGGTCAHEPVAGCCHTDADCDDASACTQDGCEGTSCEHLPIAGCCETAADCDDANPCTDDVCSDGACSHAPNTAPCDDGDACTAGDACLAGTCAGTTEPGCCTSAGDCDDADVCTTDLCTPANPAALLLDGVDDRVSAGAAPGLGASIFTIEAWFRWDGGGAVASSGSGGVTSGYPLVTKGRGEADGSNLDANYFLAIDSATGKLCADFEDTATGANHPVFSDPASPAVTTGVWHHGAATYDGTCWALYLDGALVSPAASCTGGAVPRADSIQHFGIGTALSSTGAAAGAFRGAIDEVRVWSLARTQAEIQADMSSAVVAAPGLVGRWGLDEGAGTTAADSTTPAENGTLAGGAAWLTSGTPPVGEGACTHDPIPGCCTSGSDCDDADPCTLDTCDAGACTHESIPGCCETSADCDDGNACTDDACSGNVCQNAFNAAPCDDGDACTGMDVCEGGVCMPGAQLPGCCVADAQCDDGLPCTADACPLAANAAGLVLDGTDDHVTMGAAPGLGAAQLTLELWLRRTAAGVATSTGSGGITAVPLIAKGRAEADGTTQDMNYFLGIDGSGRLAADFEEGATGASPGLNHPIVGATALTSNVWHHAAATYDGTRWNLYLDGRLDGTLVVGQPPRSDSIQHFAVGTAMTSTGAAAGAFAGAVDEVRVWSRALTLAEIQAGMHRQIAAGSGLIGRWGLDEGAGTLAGDSTSPAENGTLQGGAAWETSPAALPDLGTPNTCQNEPITDPGAGCCATDPDCADADPCTLDTCTAEGCSHEPIPGCTVCSTDAQCGDASDCTVDRCNTANDRALSFDGTNDHVTMGTAPGLGTAAFTLEAWVRRTGAGVATSTGGFTNGVPIVAKGRGEADGSTVDCNYFLGLRLTDFVLGADYEEGAGQTSPGANHPVYGATPIPLNTWMHVAATFDGTTWRLYVNGLLDGTLVVGANRSPRSDSIQHFAIGSALTSTGAAGGFFAGQIDEVRVWSHARTQAEIQASMHREVRTGTGLLGSWSLNEGTGTSAADSTTPAENGTLTGGPTWTTEQPLLGNDTCAHDPAPTGTSCSDASACTADDACDGAGACLGSLISCDDANPCTDDLCDSLTGCLHAANDANTCADGDACNGVETCSGGSCQPGVPPAPPAEISDLVAQERSPTRLTWTAQPGFHHDVAGGMIAALPIDSGVAAATCLENDWADASWVDGRPDPAPGEGYYYIVRPQSACATGTYGFASSGAERSPVAACP